MNVFSVIACLRNSSLQASRHLRREHLRLRAKRVQRGAQRLRLLPRRRLAERRARWRGECSDVATVLSRGQRFHCSSQYGLSSDTTDKLKRERESPTLSGAVARTAWRSCSLAVASSPCRRCSSATRRVTMCRGVARADEGRDAGVPELGRTTKSLSFSTVATT